MNRMTQGSWTSDRVAHRRRPPKRQRVHDDRVGPGLQTTHLQDRRLPGDPAAKGRGPCAGSHQQASAPVPDTPTTAPATGGGAATSSHVLDETPRYALDPSQEN